MNEPGDREVLKTLGTICQRLASSAWFSYLTILALQLKVTWNMWLVRDLTSGDTSSYFINAYGWFHQGSTPITWSPLYITFYSSLLHLSSDVFFVTTLHRWLTVMILAVTVLAVMRRLLPADIAWLMTAWWVILPINFDALYEVHLFAVIPVLFANIVILQRQNAWCRGAALGLLLATSLLMRNELLLATVLLAAMLVCATLWRARRTPLRSLLSARTAAAYTIPFVCAGLLTFYYYRHASDKAEISANLDRKHTLNVCQTYSFGYQQRHTDFTKSPWTDCQELMMSTFGKPEPTLVAAMIRNPRAMFEHFAWNLALFPNGLQVLLFNVTSGENNPDYAPVIRWWVAFPCSLIVLAIAIAGIVLMVRNWRYWWSEWLEPRGWAWVLLLSVAAVTFGVMISQRPRPSYMFSLGVLLRAATGVCLLALVNVPSWRRRMLLAFPPLVLLAVALVPSFYNWPEQHGTRPLLTAYERLAPYQKYFEKINAVLVSPGYGFELCAYVGKGNCLGQDYSALRTRITSQGQWPPLLESVGATLVYADETVLSDRSGQGLVQESIASGWQTLAIGDADGQRWRLLSKEAPREKTMTSLPAPGLSVTLRSGDIPVVGDWNGDGTAKIGIFRNGVWYLDTDGSHHLHLSSAIGWGKEGDIPVVGDWNHDGRTKIGVFSKGIWFLDMDGSHQLSAAKIVGWGQPGDIPVLGDWNKDGRTKIGVYRSDTWILDLAGTHAGTAAGQFTVDVK